MAGDHQTQLSARLPSHTHTGRDLSFGHLPSRAADCTCVRSYVCTVAITRNAGTHTNNTHTFSSVLTAQHSRFSNALASSTAWVHWDVRPERYENPSRPVVQGHRHSSHILRSTIVLWATYYSAHTSSNEQGPQTQCTYYSDARAAICPPQSLVPAVPPCSRCHTTVARRVWRRAGGCSAHRGIQSVISRCRVRVYRERLRHSHT